MLIPIRAEHGRKAFPLVSLILLLANAAVFLGLQHDDSRLTRSAQRFYVSSGLARIEKAYYQHYRSGTPIQEAYTRAEGFGSEGRDRQRIAAIQADGAFLEWVRSRLEDGDSPPHFETWRRLRRSFEAKLRRVTSYDHGLIPYAPEPLDWLSAMFLHGGPEHLLGNMLFLCLAGFLLESGIGSLRFSVCYLWGGLAAALPYVACNPDQATPLIGASGAIASLLGAISVRYGLKRIKVFLSLGVYFNFFRMPAILMLPFWLGKEVWALLSSPQSEIAFLAHIGGLAGGAFFGLIDGRLPGSEPLGEAAPQGAETRAPKLDAARDKLRGLDVQGARDALQEVLAEDAESLEALRLLYRIDKAQGDPQGLAETAGRLLRALLRSNAPKEEILAWHKDYAAAADPARLPPLLAADLAALWLEKGDLAAARGLVAGLLQAREQQDRVPVLLLRLAEASRRLGDRRQASGWLRLLLERFPDSEEAGHVRRLRRRQTGAPAASGSPQLGRE